MEFVKYLSTAFTHVSVGDVVTAVVFALTCYLVFAYAEAKHAGWYAKLVILLTLLFALYHFFAVRLQKAEVILYFVFIVLCSVIVFAQDVRRDVTHLSWRLQKQHYTQNVELSNEEIDRVISVIVKASQSMAKQDIGALMIIAPEYVSNYILESGTILNAKLSSELLETLFFPKSPLHDGAVLISKNTVLAAGCYLPLTQSTTVDRNLGTRHRAAIGMTEMNPSVTAIVVSEETGIISVMYNGKIKRYLDAELLTEALQCAYHTEDRTRLNAFWRLGNEE